RDVVLDLVDGRGLHERLAARNRCRPVGHGPRRARHAHARLLAELVEQLGEDVVLRAVQVRDVAGELVGLLAERLDRLLQRRDLVLLALGVGDLRLFRLQLHPLFFEHVELQVPDGAAAREQDDDEGDDPDDRELFLVHFAPPCGAGAGVALIGVAPALGGVASGRFGLVARPNIETSKSISRVSSAALSRSSFTTQLTLKLINVRVSWRMAFSLSALRNLVISVTSSPATWQRIVMP